MSKNSFELVNSHLYNSSQHFSTTKYQLFNSTNSFVVFLCGDRPVRASPGGGAQKEAFFPLWGQRRKFSSLASTPDRVRESFCLGPSSKKRGLRMRHVCSAPQLGKKLIGFDASSPLLFLMVLWVTENRMHIRMKQTREKKGKDLLFRTCTGKTFFFGLGRRELETNNFPTWFSLASCCIPAPTPKKVFVQSCY